MGYTNYWKRNSELPANAFAAAVKDCKKMLKKLGVPLGSRDGTGRPIFCADEIAFNGKAPEYYETFAVQRIVGGGEGQPRVFQFCKTNQRPYDLCVQAALIILKHHLGDTLVVSSDGEESDWENARAACQRGLGYGGEFRLEK